MTPLIALFVTHNSAEFIGAAVNSCLQQGLEVLVVDNASADGTLAAIPAHASVQVVVNERNLGFAGAVNQGVLRRPAELYLLLNPDIVLQDPVGPLVTDIVDNRHNAATALLVHPDGEPQKGFSFRRLPTPATLAFEVLGINRIWPANPVNQRYRCADLDASQAQKVEQPAGACFLFRRADWERLGGFDEGFYPVWFEDVDFCQRLVSTGGTIWFNPSVRVVHFGGHSVQKIELGCRQRVWYGSLLRYAAKHFSSPWRRVVAVTVALAVVPRILFGRSGDDVRSKIQSIKCIWRLAWRCFQTGYSTEDRSGG